MNQSKFPPRGYATRFKNQFDVPVYFHAFASEEKAIEDAGRAGEVVPFIPLAEHNYLISQLEEKLVKAEYDREAMASLWYEGKKRLEEKRRIATEALSIISRSKNGFLDTNQCGFPPTVNQKAEEALAAIKEKKE